MSWSWRPTVAMSLGLGLLGVGSVLLPWTDLTIFGARHDIRGLDVWQGRVAAGLCAALVLAIAVTDRLRVRASWRPWGLAAVGAAVLVVAGLYLVPFLSPRPPRIRVQKGGAAARAVAENLIAHMQESPGPGAPAALAAGLGLVVLGVIEGATSRRQGAAPARRGGLIGLAPSGGEGDASGKGDGGLR